MPARNVILNEHQNSFIEAGITSGRFSDANEVVGEALRLLEERDEEDRAKLEWLRAAAKEGFDALDRGEYTEFHSEEELADFFKDLHKEVVAEMTAKHG